MALPIVTGLLSTAGAEALQLLLPDLVKLIEGLVSGGSSAQQTAAMISMALDGADFLADKAENAKFPVT